MKRQKVIPAVVTTLLLGGFATVGYVGFNYLLTPNNTIKSATMSGISNPYETSEGSKGIIYDSKGNPIIATIVVDSDGNPVTDDNGDFTYVKDLSLEEADKVNSRRYVVADNVKAWSNIITQYSSGYDLDFSNLLEDIPVDTGDSTDISLTIDSMIQSGAYEILGDVDGLTYLSAVVYDCNSGNVLAEVSTPSYDFNSFRNSEIPWMYENTDSSYDCVQDYYKKWQEAKEKDESKEGSSNNVKELIAEWKAGENGAIYDEDYFNSVIASVKDYESGVSTKEPSRATYAFYDMIMLYKEQEATLGEPLVSDSEYEALKVSNQKDGYDFEAMYKYKVKKGRTDSSYFPWEPSTLGDGKTYVPFVKVTFDDKTYYMRLYYGNNNFIYEDCAKAGIDLNFSFTDYAVLNTAPGSTIKMFMAALLYDQGSTTLLSNGTMNINKPAGATDGSSYTKLRPSASTYRNGYLGTLQDGLNQSDNDYFLLCALSLGDITTTTDSSYTLGYKSSYSFDDLNNSASILQNFFTSKFCFNTSGTITPYFTVAQPRILGNIGSIKEIESKQNLSENYTDERYPVYYPYSDKTTKEVNYNEPYMLSEEPYVKALGDTGYGQGYTSVSPMFMSVAMGKMLTGTMYMPNVLQTELGNSESNILGEEFDREDATVSYMRQALEDVSTAHYSESMKSYLTYYEKTGTCVVDKGEGTQSTYGLFAGESFGNYTTQTTTTNGVSTEQYETIWYCGAVEDSKGNLYSIVIRALFNPSTGRGSYGLKTPFLRICELLESEGYLVAE